MNSAKNASVEVHLGSRNTQVNAALEHKTPFVLVSGSGVCTDSIIEKINTVKSKAGIVGNEDRNNPEVHKRLLRALAEVDLVVDLHLVANRESALETLDRIRCYDYKTNSFEDSVFRIVIIDLFLITDMNGLVL